MLLKKHTWRDFYNPISGLSMPRLVAMENADPNLAQEQSAMLRSAYEIIENFREAILFLASGLFRGFAHLEKIPHRNPLFFSRLDPVEQWFWARDGHFGPWCFNAESQSSAPKSSTPSSSHDRPL